MKKSLKHAISLSLTVESLDIAENKVLLNDTRDLKDSVKIALKKFKSHPIIIAVWHLGFNTVSMQNISNLI